MYEKEHYTIAEVANLLSISRETLRRWDRSGKLPAIRHPINDYRVYHKSSLKQFQSLGFLFEGNQERSQPKAEHDYSVIELFAGAGGLALGLERSGLRCALLNEIDKNAAATLRKNRPHWNVLEGDVAQLDFRPYAGKIDIVTGGFPCQAFSYAGKKLGFDDIRGTLFYEFARAIKETEPLIALGENVRGLLTHDHGRTLQGMISVLDELGYDVLPPVIAKTIFYRVPQKRERLIIVALKRGLGLAFEFPKPYKKTYSLRDALKAGELFPTDCPSAPGQTYTVRKKEIMALVPPGGYWRDLPIEIQKEYMLGSFYLGGGKTGMARRMSWDEPCLTLTCNPAQKQTERCHPEETRPLNVREYARIQTFPDDWQFTGSVSSQYKQIGNAVPVNFAEELGRSLVACLNQYFLDPQLRHRKPLQRDLFE